MQVSPAGVGTTSPSPGITEEPTGSVVVVTAGPSNPQYNFTGWTGSVTNPTNPFTTIVISGPLTAVANFAPCNCVIDASSYLTVTRGPIVLNPITKRYAQTVTVKNTSSITIFGPISLVLFGLSSNATLANASGSTSVFGSFSPYITANGNLSPGQSVSFSLQFTDPTNAAITYATSVLSGPGPR
jgi:uncharacterized repeat protein (TIGR02543 family)